MTHVEELKSSGLKATLPRIKILEVFQQNSARHMTAEDVFKSLLAEGADIGLATVYRVLMQFEQAGILARSHFESGKSVFELNEGSDIGLATVYRVLMQFEQAGLLTRSNFESGKAVFELNEGQHHDHLVCVTCGRVEEFYDPEIEQRQRHIAETRGFELQEHSLSLYARCTKAVCPHRNPK